MSTDTPHGHAAERAYQWIKERILRNHWEAGASLKESPLSREIGVSRTPVREALRRLTLEGLVETIPNQGSRLQKWSDQDLDEIFGLRVLLESHGARLAAQRITDDEQGKLCALCDAMEELLAKSFDDMAARQSLTRLNEQFHALILAAAHSERLKSLTAQVISFPLVYRTFAIYDKAEILRSMAHHRELADAFRARDPVWAESVMRAHLSAGHQATRRMLIRGADE
ncbi:GntR family transcriptional regulator [Allopusillimonas soli]|uniref:GntR family transcriptional regulator n=1 Tax=Allopusillimonas soli TaxID=659016 RepID=A0A853F5H7_9BURK|nr:GntR family transcriptional regulator [Allopusillimonas soli]NYT35363.1 GntR family transcriptional regulator [Allopusillimonas soli]TEA75781.1 GntR family transcriptional regulator [Allopusillimonas soli]